MSQKEPSLLTPLPPSSAGTPEGFGEFWAAYPRQIGRDSAERAWRKLNPDEETRKKILEVLPRMKETRQWKKANGQYICYPARWISEHRWEDSLEEMNRGYDGSDDLLPAQRYTQRDYEPMTDEDYEEQFRMLTKKSEEAKARKLAEAEKEKENQARSA